MNAATAIEGYAPKSVAAEAWKVIGPSVIEAVTKTLGIKPTPSAYATVARLGVVSRYLAWCLDNGFDLDFEEVFTEDRIEAYFASGAVTVRAKATYRSHLRTVAKANTKKAIWTPTPQLMKNQNQRPPYSADEVSGFFDIVDLQPTDRQRFVMRAVLLCCLGFGLKSHEMFLLRCEQVSRTEYGLVLATLEDRTVPAQARYADEIWDLISDTDTERLLGDHLRVHKGLDNLITKFDIPRYLPSLRTRRLRTTYLFDLLNNRALNLAEFMHIAGLGSGRVLEDLVRRLEVDHATLLTRGALGPTVVPTEAGDLDG